MNRQKLRQTPNSGTNNNDHNPRKQYKELSKHGWIKGMRVVLMRFTIAKPGEKVLNSNLTVHENGLGKIAKLVNRKYSALVPHHDLSLHPHNHGIPVDLGKR